MEIFQKKESTDKCIYFGHLHPDLDELWLLSVVRNFGQGYNVRVIIDEKKPYNYGFVDMVAANADRCLGFFRTHSLLYNNEEIIVKPAQTEPSKRSKSIEKHKRTKMREIQRRYERRENDSDEYVLCLMPSE